MMVAITRGSNGRERLTFGPREWVAFLAIALVPASGLATFGYSMGQSLAINDHHDAEQDKRIDVVVESLDELLGKLTLVVRHDERLKDMERRVSRLEGQ